MVRSGPDIMGKCITCWTAAFAFAVGYVSDGDAWDWIGGVRGVVS